MTFNQERVEEVKQFYLENEKSICDTSTLIELAYKQGFSDCYNERTTTFERLYEELEEAA